MDRQSNFMKGKPMLNASDGRVQNSPERACPQREVFDLKDKPTKPNEHSVQQ
jgi:hypothetical protein